MSKVGMNVTYTPTVEEQPMAQGQPQAALVTGWDENSNQASLIVFPKDANYGYFKDNVVEGTDPGTFQQFASGSGTQSATPPAAAAHSTSSHKK